ncbi:transposase [Salmonella enterica subsp. enterica serovar Sandiego]|uniref:Mu transposase C-terminal domain-containing protein n=1 Tax=Salmonella enterica TaxID=28901 RepID=UPI0008FC35C3|nr:Mu transposase C-terminal domain-containing protein [Salmonella enterica]EAN3292264.1 transposase [Salmonella enterica subsp. enterica serovar Oranienburg]EAR0437023.1 transposase [Salmonella enterica subsp. enterica serovar Poona]ECC9951972.1 transposase [Salmonella enterica subsp. enterica]MCT7053534.1 Mu transposase C-terminal domain-containing protein [Salmonella enterica subsp. enterica serovar Sandiego]MCT7095797.1 Mu transposase C-terminal domain-containing protein [Salmonella enteri
MWVTAKECAGIKGFPSAEKNARIRLERATEQHPEWRRKRAGSKAFEYHIDCLPAEVQKVLRERHLKQLMATSAPASDVPAVVKARTPKNPDDVRKIDVYRKCPALMEEKLAELTDNQRRAADARAALVCEVLKLGAASRCSNARAIRFIVSQIQNGEISAQLLTLVQVANAKKGNDRTLSEITLKRWVADYNKAQTAAERLLLLAPGKRQPLKPEQIPWLGDFLAHYSTPNGVPVSEAYDDFKAEWQQRYAGQPYMLDAMPGYDAVRYALDKLPAFVKQRGRVTGIKARQIEGFVRRDWCSLPVNYVWIGDGHGMKMRCLHPVHGQPFSPEVTFVIDGACRYITGWSLALAENTMAVAGAIKHGIQNCGKPFLYYSDNGPGETGQALDAEITGILPRLGIDHPTGIAGNAQGRGIIERLNRTLPVRIARKYPTYFGKGADQENQRVLVKDLKSAFNAMEKGNELNARQRKALEQIPSFAQVYEAIAEGVEWYNNREHSELPKKPGTGRHYTPAEFRRYKLEKEETEIEYLSPFELRDMFMHRVIRTVNRCEIKIVNNIYYATELRPEHGNKVFVDFDIHDAEKVIIRRLDGSFICEAVWNANKRLAFPVTAEYVAQQARLKGRRARGEAIIREAEAEARGVLDTPREPEPLPGNTYVPTPACIPAGNVVLVQEQEEDEDYATQETFGRGLRLWIEEQEEQDPFGDE